MHPAPQPPTPAGLAAVIARYPWWDGVARDFLAARADRTNLVELPRGRSLFVRGESPPGLVFVHTGELKVTLPSPEGREQIVWVAGPGRLIVEGVQGPPDHCRASCIAREWTVAWVMPNAVVDEAIGAEPAVGRALFQHAMHAAARATDRLYDVALCPVEERLAAFIARLATRIGSGTDGPITIERSLDVGTVAGLIGTVREEITRQQARLRDRGLIDLSRDRIVVPDLEALRHFAGL